MAFTSHSQLRFRVGRELDLARAGLLQEQYWEREGQECCLSVQGSDPMRSKLGREGNEDLMA